MSGDGLLFDPLTVTCLGHGWHAGMTIDAEGQPWPWLIGPHDAGCSADTYATPPHEDLGPLPARFREPCGALTLAGEPCRNLAKVRSGRCYKHEVSP